MSRWLFWPGAPPASYAANPVDFDGTVYLTSGAALTGAADSKIYTGSVWVRRSGANALERILFASNQMAINPNTSSTNDIRVNAGDASVRARVSFPVPVADTAWHHLLWSFDVSNISTRNAYIDDSTTGIVWVTWSDTTLDFTHANWGIGAETNGTIKFAGELADLQIWFGTYVDLSVEANRRLFVTATGEPVDPATAEAALGEPIIQMTGATGSWHTNKGAGGGFTLNAGTLTTGTTPVEF